MTRIIDHALTALTSALLTALFIILAGGGMVDARIDAAVSEHAAQPLDSNDRIIVRWEYPDGTEALPPQEVALWEYVWLPQSELSSRLSSYDFAVGYILTDPEMQGHLERHGLTPDEQQLLRSKLGVD